MKNRFLILFLGLTLCNAAPLASRAGDHTMPELTPMATRSFNGITIDYYGDILQMEFQSAQFVDLPMPFTAEGIAESVHRLRQKNYEPIFRTLRTFRKKHQLDDWLYYQLIRKTAEQISPKADNYARYTLYKWWLLTGTGYDALLTVSDDRILFYVQSPDNIYNIPYRVKEGKKYICLNYHDYGYDIDFSRHLFREVLLPVEGATQAFTYKVTSIPALGGKQVLEKDLQFTYNNQEYSFRIKLNPAIKTLFTNYPASDYESHFNIPLSEETYGSLIPSLRKQVKGLKPRDGVEFLMHFTRYAFLFKNDTEQFGQEKRLSPEQTLLYEYSDCDDRASLFFYLVREIYNLPMLVVLYPKHVTIAVQFDKPVGSTIEYNGQRYTICEPTPQSQDLRLGQLPASLRQSRYEIAYAYTPGKLH